MGCCNYTNFETTSAFVTVKVTPKWIRYSWTPVSGYPGGGVWDTTIFERDFQTEAYTVFPLESVFLGDDIIVPGHEPLGAPTTPTPGMIFEQPGGYEYTLESINQRPAPPSPTLDPNVWPELALVVRRSGEAGGIVTSSDPFIEQTESFTITLGQSLDIKVMATSAGYLQ
ncbi:hypothetical protein CMV30_17100 [Nibricoccus aquaticus]|uniref:Uncharacterized protein n=1 Tax=Nibricoccus aquaticus TaxID=2576891 RepID=A0A290QBA2_9BACT|nr:hypothetical protein CMV30_17100 [Nibricoccus aquaticus]